MRVSRERRFRHAIIRAAVALLAWFDDAVSADGFLAATKTPESTYLRVVRLRAARRPPLGDEHHVVRLRRHDGGGRRVAPVARRRVTLAVVFESELVADFVRDNRRRRDAASSRRTTETAPVRDPWQHTVSPVAASRAHSPGPRLRSGSDGSIAPHPSPASSPHADQRRAAPNVPSTKSRYREEMRDAGGAEIREVRVAPRAERVQQRLWVRLVLWIILPRRRLRHVDGVTVAPVHLLDEDETKGDGESAREERAGRRANRRRVCARIAARSVALMADLSWSSLYDAHRRSSLTTTISTSAMGVHCVSAPEASSPAAFSAPRPHATQLFDPSTR